MRYLILLVLAALPALPQCGPAAVRKPIGNGQYSCVPKPTVMQRTGTLTSGKVPAVDASGNLVDSPMSCTGGNCSIAPTLPVTVAVASPQAVTLSGDFYNNSAGAMTFNLPAITSGTVGNRYCFFNDSTRTGAITVDAPADTTIDVDGTPGSVSGTLVSSGALGDSVCVRAKAVGAYKAVIGTGTWTNN